MTAARSRRSILRPREISSRSAEETIEIGERIGRSLEIPAVILLRGALGTGKTTLARGIARGLGVDDAGEVSSPSFTLVNVYRGRVPIYHVDLYRLETGCDLDGLGLDEFMGRDGVTVLEWSERLPFPVEGAMVIELDDAGGDSRRLRVYPESPPARPERRSRRASGGARPDRRSGRSRPARPAPDRRSGRSRPARPAPDRRSGRSRPARPAKGGK